MIGVLLQGGLGNQMFQVTAARALAQRLGTKVFLDRSTLLADPKRSFALSPFGISANIGVRDRWFRFRLRQGKVPVVLEPRFGWWEGFDALVDDVMLEGFWQGYRYVERAGSKVDQWFSQPLQRRRWLQARYPALSSENAVSVHIRRGDYVECRETAEKHLICDQSYFDRAVDAIRTKVPESRLYVFSDDVAWAKDWAREQADCVVISGDTELRDVDELFLMSQCCHHILSNSTFSWWGAWLGRYENSVVLAPDRWFANCEVEVDDLLPPHWHRIVVP